MVLPVPIEGSPEILETTDYTPDRIAVGDDWSSFVFGGFNDQVQKVMRDDA
jgi:hypothetical protein